MFKITPNPTFETNVILSLPGGQEVGEIRITFRYFKPADLEVFLEERGTLAPADVVKEIMTGWNDVKDSDGNDVPFNNENLATLLANYHAAGREILVAWRMGLSGARAKN